MRNLAPKTSPEANEVVREDWIQSILGSGAWRAKGRSLPMLWLLIASAFAFPMGLLGSFDATGQADEVESTVAPSASTPESAATVVDGDVKPEATKSQAEKVEESAPVVNATDPASHELPALPEPPLTEKVRDVATSVLTGTQTMRVQVLVSGKVFNRKLQLERGATVRDAIEAVNLKINSYDKVAPAVKAAAYDGVKIRITRIRNEVKSRSISVKPESRFQLTTELRPGQSKTVQSARSGLIQVSERVWFKDGKVSHRENLGQKIVRKPQDEIVALGARAAYMPGKIPYHNRYARAYTLASRSGSPRDRVESYQTKTLRPIRSITLTATGYSPDPRENGGWTTTATGLPIGYGAAAVDPRVIPLGTKMYVEGYGYAFACDVGGAIKGRRIDLAYNSYYEANTKGRKKVRVWILAP